MLYAVRTLFILLMAAVGWYFLSHAPSPNHALIFGHYTWLTLGLTIIIAVAVVFADLIAPRKKLAIVSGVIMGIVVGLLIAYALGFLAEFMIDRYLSLQDAEQTFQVISFVKLILGLVCCYLAVSFILQTRDDFRFIIPYVEFAKQTKGSRPILLDTSVLIDGRIADIIDTGIAEARLIVPRFVLKELQAVADSGDKLKRNRGRRGLDVLQKLQNNKKIDVVIYDAPNHPNEAGEDVDQRLLTLAVEMHGRVLTNDFNLNKVASVRGVDVININDLANALKPVVLPGEQMVVSLHKAGEGPGQGVGYLNDGTMVVVEQGRGHLNEEVEFTVTSVIQTSAGKMIFGRMAGEPAAVPESVRRPRGKPESSPT
jgi:uncharacterized protein YacL